MLHEPADDCNAQLNFNLSSSLSDTNVDITSSQLNLLDSSNDSSSITADNKCLEHKTNTVIPFSLKSEQSDLLPSSTSAEKLSWKFLEQVDTLDNQLRIDASSPPALLNGGLFLRSPASAATENVSSLATNDVNSIVANSLNALGMHSNHHHHQHLQPNQHNLQLAQTQTHTLLPQGCSSRLMRRQIQQQRQHQQQQQRLQVI